MSVSPRCNGSASVNPSPLFASLLLLLIPLTGVRGETTATLALSALFDVRPGDPGYSEAPARALPGGPTLLLPDTSAWLLPRPSPTPAPTPVETPLPFDLARLRELAPDRTRPLAETGLRDIGQEPGLPRRDSVRVDLLAPYRVLSVQYRFVSAEPAQRVVILRHPPGTVETIRLPLGVWSMEQRVWRAEAPTAFHTRTFRALELRKGSHYEFRPDEDEEASLLRSLRAD